MVQGEAISPSLFSLITNDFENELINGFSEPLYIQHLSLFLLMHDVLLSESTCTKVLNGILM